MKKLQLADKQMDRFTWEELEKLIVDRKGPCVSLFLPAEAMPEGAPLAAVLRF